MDLSHLAFLKMIHYSIYTIIILYTYKASNSPVTRSTPSQDGSGLERSDLIDGCLTFVLGGQRSVGDDESPCFLGLSRSSKNVSKKQKDVAQCVGIYKPTKDVFIADLGYCDFCGQHC